MSRRPAIDPSRSWRAKAALLVLLIATIGWASFIAVEAGRSTAIPAMSSTFTPRVRTIPSSLWIGDSYPAGAGAPSVAQGESCLTARAMGWTCNLDAEGGTGYRSNGHLVSSDYGPLPTRLAGDRRRYYADIVVVDAGRGDGESTPQSVLLPAIDDELGGIRRAWPRARLIVIAPYFMRTEFTSAQRKMFTTAARRYHAIALDPVAEGWISPRIVAKMTFRDGIHPNAAGHLYIAAHLVSDLRRHGLTTIPITDPPTSDAS